MNQYNVLKVKYMILIQSVSQGRLLTQTLIPLHTVWSIIQAPRFSSSIPESYASVTTKSCAGRLWLFFPCFGLQRMSCAAISSLCR